MAAASSSSPPADLCLVPAGFRFQPTDQELIVEYLKPRVSNPNFKVDQFLIKEFDVFSVEPWRLPGDSFQYQSVQKDMYFFTPRRPTSKGSQRASRMAGSGFWQNNGRDNLIERKTKVRGAVKTEVIGHKTQLTFKTRKGTGYENSQWIMNEFRLHYQDARKFDSVVLCRIHKKKTKRDREEVADTYVGEEEEEAAMVEGRLAKRRRLTEKDVGNEEEAVPILHVPQGQEEEKELERQVIMGLLKEHALMKVSGWTLPCWVVDVQEQESAADTVARLEMGRQIVGYQQGLVGDSNEAESSGVDNTMSTSQPASVNDDLPPLEDLICLDDFPPHDTEMLAPPSFSLDVPADVESIPSCADLTEGCSFDPDKLSCSDELASRPPLMVLPPEEGPAPLASGDFLCDFGRLSSWEDMFSDLLVNDL